MRLRLRIERNALPVVQTVWPVQDQSLTVSQLLQQVSNQLPLDSDTWGLEDYAVILGNYDLLFHHALKDVLKDEDEVTIKPLGWEDLRKRAMTGRDQISADGRHLYDGVAFGRPAVKAPIRPRVKIPPRKKVKLSQEEAPVTAQDPRPLKTAKTPLMLTNGVNGHAAGPPPDPEDSEDDEDDEDYEPEKPANVAPEKERTKELNGETESIPEDDEFPDFSSSVDSSSSDSDSSESFSSSVDSSSSESDSSDSLSESEAEEEGDEWDGFIDEDLLQSAVEASTAAEGKTKVTSSKKRALSQVNQKDKTPRPAEDTASTDIAGTPAEGKAATQARNARRRDSKRLKHLKASGEVPQNMTLAQMRRRNDTQAPNGDVTAEAVSTNTGATSAKEQSVDAADDANGADTAKQRQKAKQARATTQTGENVEERRLQLLAAINSGGVDVNGIGGAQDEEPPEELPNGRQAAIAQKTSQSTSMMPPSVAAAERRATLDLAGSKRLLFGSLGVRVPKTQEEKDALQQKLASESKRKPVSLPTPSQTDGQVQKAAKAMNGKPAASNDPEAWRKKINLKAVECVDEDITLSEPPFPFHQRWDEQYNRRGKKRPSSSLQQNGKKRKRNSATEDEAYDKYNADGYGDALNYDDEEDDDYWEDGALLNGSTAEDEADDSAEDDDLPPLPGDITTLSLLSGSEAAPNDIITFPELACDASTDWQPQMTTRTARIIQMLHNGKVCECELSKRDVKPPRYDEEGNRVYGKFEMPRDDEEEGLGERVRVLAWEDMGEVRVVRKAGV